VFILQKIELIHLRFYFELKIKLYNVNYPLIDRKHNGQKKKDKEKFEDTKGVIRVRKSKKDRQHNGQKKKNKQRSTQTFLCPFSFGHCVFYPSLIYGL
jgi:hypothetical protein